MKDKLISAVDERLGRHRTGWVAALAIILITAAVLSFAFYFYFRMQCKEERLVLDSSWGTHTYGSYDDKVETFLCSSEHFEVEPNDPIGFWTSCHLGDNKCGDYGGHKWSSVTDYKDDWNGGTSDEDDDGDADNIADDQNAENAENADEDEDQGEGDNDQDEGSSGAVAQDETVTEDDVNDRNDPETASQNVESKDESAGWGKCYSNACDSTRLCTGLVSITLIRCHSWLEAYSLTAALFGSVTFVLVMVYLLFASCSSGKFLSGDMEDFASVDKNKELDLQIKEIQKFEERIKLLEDKGDNFRAQAAPALV